MKKCEYYACDNTLSDRQKKYCSIACNGNSKTHLSIYKTDVMPTHNARRNDMVMENSSPDALYAISKILKQNEA